MHASSVTPTALMAVPFGVAPTAPEKAEAQTVDTDKGGQGTITISNPVKNEVYKVYKVFDATTNDDTATNGSTGKNIAYTYTRTGSEDAFYTALTGEGFPFTLTATSTSNVYNVSLKDSNTSGEAIATFLKAHESNLGDPVNGTAGTTANEESSIEFTGLQYGYYYITTTTGSTVTIDSAAKSVTVEDKNTVPSIDKQQSLDRITYTKDNQYVNIGDTVHFKIIVKAGKTNDKEIKVTDTLSNGLTLNENSNGSLTDKATIQWADSAGTVYSDTDHTRPTAGTDYSVSSITNRGFVVTFTANFVKKLAENDQIIISYSATVNKDAVTGTDANTNTAKLEYSNQPATEVTTKDYTYDFDVVKTDSSRKLLSGAKFKLYPGAASDSDGGVTKTGDAFYFVKTDATSDTPATYTLANSTDEGATQEIDVTNGNVRIKGLKNAVYALEETQAPSGYNPLTAPVKVDLQAANNRATIATSDGTSTWTSGGVQVINNAGSALPNTGGPGTVWLYVVGGVLVVAAGVGLVARRRMRQH